ncbi:MAG: 16S rRNA (cytidine(1402)-2'-O)-methyltransferase [Clostridiales bacterium]|nr:16S rRNA (cytidine(1402)-2'-O)-methyltransferase [Clostridiales bacterium]MCF8021541.1 16S rRNA (cytidine(1402)-2'-O)-methyltransferase [Clostridiales bacterium]
MARNQGNLYLCPTPIGNLEDITFRVIRTLKEVDLIAAEDTRRTRKLLSYYDIHNNITSYNEHNHRAKSGYILNLLEEGNNIAVVSDAGTPGISDPGEELVKEVAARNIRINPLPGPNAALSALIVSGLSARSFVFEGFLPSARKDKKKKLQNLAAENKTLIFYESPYRLRDTLTEIYRCLGNRKIVIARELTKKFEEILRNNVLDTINFYIEHEPKGEYTIIVEGKNDETQVLTEEQEGMSVAEHVDELISQGIHRKEAIKKVSRLRGIPKREVYNKVLSMKNK